VVPAAVTAGNQVASGSPSLPVPIYLSTGLLAVPYILVFCYSVGVPQ
jgi:hypothetical protein